MSTVDERVQKELQEFEKVLREVLAVAKSPDSVVWGIFSTGDVETEDACVRQLVPHLFPHVQGVYVFNVRDGVDVGQLLQAAADKYANKMVQAKLEGADHEFKLTMGV